MRWKDIIIGAIGTLVVTVIGGIIVYYVTKEPAIKKSEDIYFEKQQSEIFSTERRKIGLSRIVIKNLGNEMAEKVVAIIDFGSLVIVDQSAKSSTGFPIGLESHKVGSPNLSVSTLTLDSLAPTERIELTFILNGEKIPEPKISLKSKKQLGQEFDPLKHIMPAQPLWQKLLFSSIPLAIIAQVVILVLVRKFGSAFVFLGNPNNTAFMLMHKGRTGFASRLLAKRILEKGASSYELANYGLALALSGSYDDAKALFDCARFYSSSNKIKGLLEFYESIIEFRRNNVDASLKLFKQSLQTSPNEIKKYAQFSDLFAEMKSKDPRFSEAIAT